DSPEAAKRELGILFGDGETFDYERETDRWINES
ncbi:MAG: nucleoside-diphosphate kinase, partial [Chloroflexi bacterium]|nr:nucleoside-diphosphate kinase [Chloroflexota bacterium]